MNLSDDLKRQHVFLGPPKRVVSLVPSDTLSVAMLGCDSTLVGRTDYCDLPHDVATRVPSIGGTKNPRVDDILDLSPDLVIANQEENSRGDLEKLAQKGVRVFVAFPKRVAEGVAHLARLARIFRVERQSADLIRQGYEAVRAAEAQRQSLVPTRTFCPIWMKPLMTIHGSTFISDMLDLCGAQNIFADRERRYPLAADLGFAVASDPEGRDVRYPRVSMDEVWARRPDWILLPSEPHPFTEDDAAAFRTRENCSVRFIDGKDLCWYGGRSVEGIERLRTFFATLRYEHGGKILS